MIVVSLAHAVVVTGVAWAQDAAGSAAAWRTDAVIQRFAARIFERIGPDQGLPHPVITGIAQDSDGFLWVGTQGGLVRFDGKAARLYRHDPDDPSTLPDNFIAAIHGDGQGRIWVATPTGWVHRYDRDQDRFRPMFRISGTTGVSVVRAMADADDGDLWVGGATGLVLFEAKRLGAQAVMLPGQSDARRQVHALSRTRDGTLWVGWEGGLAVRNPVTGVMEAVPLGGAGDMPPRIVALYEDHRAELWALSRDFRIFKVDPQSKSATAVPGKVPAELQHRQINTLAEITPGEFWIGTQDAGIVVYKTDSGAFSRIEAGDHDEYGLSSDQVRKMFQDRSGLMWTGTQRGLNRTDPQAAFVNTLFHFGPDTSSAMRKGIAAVHESADGTLRFGLISGGALDISITSGQVRRLEQGVGPTGQPTPLTAVFSIAEAGRQLWLGTRQGLYRRRDGGQPALLPLPGVDPAPSVLGLFVDGASLWIGTANAGLFRMTLPEGPLERLPGPWDGHEINGIRVGPDSRLWIITTAGVYRRDGTTGGADFIPSGTGDPFSLPTGGVYSVLFDQRGRAWLSSLGGGIGIVAGQDDLGRPLVTRLTTRDGLPHDNVGTLLQDRQGRIWAGTAAGLAMIDPDTLTIRRLQRAEGVVGSSFFARSGTVTQDGLLVFGRGDGVTTIRPERLGQGVDRQPLRFTEIRVGQGRIAEGPFNRDPRDPPTAEITLTPEIRRLEAEFAVLDYGAPDRIRYAYKMEGFDSDWIEAGADRRRAIYSNLPPGSYQLRVRATDRAGTWLSEILILPVRVLPAWHQTVWFQGLLSIAALGAVAATVMLRTAWLRRRQRELEREVAARTADLDRKRAELVDANTALAQSADTLRLLGAIGQEITSNLDIDAVIRCLHRHVEGLLDAPYFAMYRYDAARKLLIRTHAVDHGEFLPIFTVELDSQESWAAQAVRERREVFFDNDTGGPSPNHIPGTRVSASLLFGPLIVDDRVLGAMTMQSPRRHAYGERERMIFRTLCAYGAVAMANAESLAALRTAQARLVEQEKMASLGQLIAGVAHEINTPLGVVVSAVSGFGTCARDLSTAASDGTLTRARLRSLVDEAGDLAAVAERNTERMVALVDAFKTISGEGASDVPQAVDLPALIRQLAGMVQDRLSAAGHRLVLDLPEALTTETLADAVVGVLGRVLDNAAEHAFPAGGQGTVTVTLRADEAGGTRIVVTDDGCGIPADLLPRVCDPFVTTARGTGHSGLGLHVAYNLAVQRLKGTLTVAAPAAGGTQVTLILPPVAGGGAMGA